MLKWLHRGLVSLLLVAAVGAGVACVAFRDFRILEREWGSGILGADNYGTRTWEIKSAASEFKMAKVYITSECRTEKTDIDFIDIVVQYQAGENTGGCLLRDYECFMYLFIKIPLWMIATLFAAYPCFFLYRTYRRRRGRPANACPHCSYDLNGNQSGTCPECGETVEVVA